jgi:hypothetical protein
MDVSSCIEYDGTTWTTGGSMLTTKRNHKAAGSQLSALAIGGWINDNIDESVFGLLTEEYDGTTWSSGGNVNIYRYNHSCAAESSSAALVWGGDSNDSNTTESYNGTTWSMAPNLPGFNYVIKGGGSGTQNAALSCGGWDIYGTGNGFNKTFEYNGTAWSAASNMLTGRLDHGSAGSQSASFATGGNTDGFTYITSTEEYTASVTAPSASGTLGEIRFNVYTNKFEGYNGTSWISFY